MENQFTMKFGYHGPPIIKSTLLKLKTEGPLLWALSKYNKRCFVLDILKRKFYYSAKELNSKIIKSHSFEEIMSFDSNPNTSYRCDWKFPFKVTTITKDYVLFSESDIICKNWCEALHALGFPDLNKNPEEIYTVKEPPILAEMQVELEAEAYIETIKEIRTEIPEERTIEYTQKYFECENGPIPVFEAEKPANNQSVEEVELEERDRKGMPFYRFKHKSQEERKKELSFEVEKKKELEFRTNSARRTEIQTFSKGKGPWIKEDPSLIQRRKVVNLHPSKKKGKEFSNLNANPVKFLKQESDLVIPKADIKEFSTGITEFMSNINKLEFNNENNEYANKKKEVKRTTSLKRPIEVKTERDEQSTQINYEINTSYRGNFSNSRKRTDIKVNFTGDDMNFNTYDREVKEKNYNECSESNQKHGNYIDSWGVNVNKLENNISLKPSVYKEKTIGLSVAQEVDMDWDTWDD